jgi:hypothetical protein
MLAHCPLCQTAYDEHSIKLLGEQAASMTGQSATRMFHLTCSSCHHAVIAVILESQNGVSSIGLVTDLEVQDAVRMHDAPPISADDCVVAHEILETKSRRVCEQLMKVG